MVKKLILAMMVFLFAFSAVCFGAQVTFQQVSRDNQEMKESIAWLTEGLYNLEQDPKLALRGEQKQRILPIFQALIQQRIVSVEQPRRGNNRDNNRDNRDNNRNGNNQNNFDEQRRQQRNANNPQAQARLKRMQEETAFGNKQSDLIDRILTEKQRAFIDNMDFNAEKYGFLDFGKLFGGNGDRQGQRPDENAMNEIRQKMQAGRELLIKLNNDVLKILQN